MSTDEALPAAWRGLKQFAFGDTPDMADELVRKDLGLVRPDEVIIPLD